MIVKIAEKTESGAAEAAVSSNHTFVSGASPAMRTLERAIVDIAPTNIPVLLLGESGTGKDILAHQMHRISLRRGEPFVKVSCTGLTPEELERPRNSHSGGNGASVAGTVFLDEISEIDPSCQSRLLKTLSDEGFTAESRWAGARVISASSRNLEDEIRSGRFREELYYRLAGLCLRLPPLRQRAEDIHELVDYFLDKHSTLLGRARPQLSTETYATLKENSWPGNVRELEHVVRNLVALGDSRLVLRELGLPPAEHRVVVKPAIVSLKEASRAASRQAERELILKVLSQTRWNRKRAAQELQISYKALLYKLKQLEVEDASAF
jgi:DNA-binding NtrC family response regulator